MSISVQAPTLQPRGNRLLELIEPGSHPGNLPSSTRVSLTDFRDLTPRPDQTAVTYLLQSVFAFSVVHGELEVEPDRCSLLPARTCPHRLLLGQWSRQSLGLWHQKQRPETS